MAKVEQSKKLTVPEIIRYCKDSLGITFKLMDEEAAAHFLEKNNYFFRLKQYADFAEKTKSGKYVNVDFGQLVELSTIDMYFRKLIFKMTIDLEHCLKVKLVNESQHNDADDGYQVVAKFLDTRTKLRDSIKNASSYSQAFYNRNIFDKYLEQPSVWAFVEMLSFSDFIDFYIFYHDFFHLNCEYKDHFESVRRLRNAAAHNTCILCSFKAEAWFHPDMEISFELAGAKLGIGQGTISSSMKIPVFGDFAVMLASYSKLITSAKVKEKTYEEMKLFFNDRMILRKHYFENVSSVKNLYKAAKSVLEYYSAK